MRLYKYYVADRINVLKENRIRFTQLDALNDPFEAAIPPHTKGKNPSGPGTVSLMTPSEARADLIKRLIPLPGVLCLTEKPDNLLMWAHYADEHKGFVIGFDSEHAMFSQRQTDRGEFGYLRKVKYQLERPSASAVVGFFLTKSVEWEYEQEWRMFLLLL